MINFKMKCLKITTYAETLRRVQLSSNFFLLLSLISHSRPRFEHVVLKKCIKSGNITDKKNRILKDFFYFLILKCRQNRKIQLCGEKNRASGMSCPLYIETEMKVWKKCLMNFRFQIWWFQLQFRFKCIIFFQLILEILKSQLCFWMSIKTTMTSVHTKSSRSSIRPLVVVETSYDIAMMSCLHYFFKKVVPSFEKRNAR